MRKIVNLNEKWAFRKEAGVPASMPENWYIVNLPHTWNAIDGQDGGNDYYRGTCCYARTLSRADMPEGEQYYLEFLGANASADVYVNGKKLAHHDGGYATWRVNITGALAGENLIVVTVDNGESETVYPQMADFTFYGGLYRDVNLIAVSRSHFDLDYFGGPGIRVTPVMQGRDARVDVQAYLTGARPGQTLAFALRDRAGDAVAEAVLPVEQTRAAFTIENAHLWNGKKDPYLYTAHVELRENGRVLDAVHARFGCRAFEIDPDKGFILNGKSYPLRGVSRHQDWKGIGNALQPEHHLRDMELIRELGATTIRLAHYQHAPYFYDLCDEYGMIVWAEIPYISKHMPGGRENTLSQMRELIVQNYNHPSIVVWGLSNEITMGGKADEDLLRNHRELNELAHALDGTRKTTMAVVSMCDIRDPYIQIPDTVSYNHYFGWYGGDVSMNGPWLDDFHRAFPTLPLGLSEYGCEALNWHTSTPRQGDYTEEYQAYYHEELIRQLFTRPYLWATHVWNMFDFGADARNEGGENGQNHKGLVTFDRQYKKDAFYAYKAWLSDEPFVHICGKRYVERVEDVTKVTVYSNLPEVELFANGRSLGIQRSAEHFFRFSVPNEGETRLSAVAGPCRDEGVIRRVAVFNEAYRLREKGAVLNWFDIAEPEGFFSLQDLVGEVSAVAEGKALIDRTLNRLSGGKKGGAKMAGFEVNDQMMKLMNGFTVLRLINMLGSMGKRMTKEELLELNGELNRIKKP